MQVYFFEKVETCRYSQIRKGFFFQLDQKRTRILTFQAIATIVTVLRDQI